MTRIDLFGHGTVEAAQPCLDVCHGDMELGGGERTGERRVRVPIDQHDIGPLVLHHRFELREHRSGLCAVRSAADVQMMIRAGMPSCSKKTSDIS